MGQKLVVVIMGQNCEKFIGMCLKSVKDADAIVFCDGALGDNETKEIVIHQTATNIPVTIIQNDYNQDDKLMNGKQRNYYLDYLKQSYKGWYALCLDADEVVEDLEQVRSFINLLEPEVDNMLFSPKMRHFIGDLGHEDATRPEHFVPHRLFKVEDCLHYPECEHPVLQGDDETRSANIRTMTIWHMSHIDEVFNVRKKYLNHMKKSQIHGKDMLHNWYMMHAFGGFPASQINLMDIPDVILNEFGFDKDFFYYQSRQQLENKHWLDIYHWKIYFRLGEKND